MFGRGVANITIKETSVSMLVHVPYHGTVIKIGLSQCQRWAVVKVRDIWVRKNLAQTSTSSLIAILPFK